MHPPHKTLHRYSPDPGHLHLNTRNCAHHAQKVGTVLKPRGQDVCHGYMKVISHPGQSTGQPEGQVSRQTQARAQAAPQACSGNSATPTAPSTVHAIGIPGHRKSRRGQQPLLRPPQPLGSRRGEQ